MKKILICTPTYNESGNIEEFCRKVFKIKRKLDLLIVDDNSPDGTSEIIEKLKKKNKRLFFLKRKKKLGIGSAIRNAFEYMLKENYDFLITLDADLSHQPEQIPIIIKKLENYDFVTGSRYMVGGKSDYIGYRDSISRLANKACKILLGIPFNEFTTSFRGYNKKSIEYLSNVSLSADGYSSQIEFIFFIYKSGLKCAEVPINFQNRQKGSSKIPRLQVIYGALKLIELFLKRIIISKKKI